MTQEDAEGRCRPAEGNGAGQPDEEPADYRLHGQPRLPGRRGGPPAHKVSDVDLQGLSPAQLFGRAVWFLRKGRGVHLVDLAARASISPGQLSAIENAKYKTWRGAADRIAHGLHFGDAAELLLRFYGSDLPVADVRVLLDAAHDPPNGDDP